jgi:hypothetical protein
MLRVFTSTALATFADPGRSGRNGTFAGDRYWAGFRVRFGRWERSHQNF